MKSQYKFAAGLVYDGSDTPILASRGTEIYADKIVSIAQRYGIPIVEDEPLATALTELEEGDEIPPKLFEPVAILLNQILSKTVKK